MTVLPIIGRELRAAARHSFSYYLRVLGVTAMLLASLLFGMENGFSPDRGAALFASLHLTLFMAIWILVPLLTADCISRERREGTLGLLFLTPLTANGVVLAKGLAHGVRALSLWLAVLPVLVVPILLGGVSWTQVMLTVLINLNAILWALAAGLLASALNKIWIRSLIQAGCLSVCFFVCMGFVAGEFLAPVFSRRALSLGYGSFIFSLVSGIGFVTNSLGIWPAYLRLNASSGMLLAMVELTVFSFGVLAAAIFFAGRRIRTVWQEEPPSERVIWWRNTFCTPVVWVGFFKRWMRRKLERNPVGWLEQRTWTGRLVTWGWFAVIVSVYSAAFSDSTLFRSFSGLQHLCAWSIAVTIGASASGSFQRERENGVLELLLVSTVGESAIVWGRLRGLWGQFLPTVGLLLGVWLYFLGFFGELHDGEAILYYAGTFLTLPVIGLYYSLRCRNFIYALLCTLAVGLLVPLVLPPVVAFIWSLFDPDNVYFSWRMRLSIWCVMCEFGLAAFLLPRLINRLHNRSFILGANDAGH